MSSVNHYAKNRSLTVVLVLLMAFISSFALQGCGGGGGGSAPTVSVSGGTVVESNNSTQNLVFTISTSAAAPAGASVVYATSDGTATAGNDYTAKNGTLSIPAGASSATVTIDITGDTQFEFDETVTLTLSSPNGLTMGTPSSADGTITDDDDANTKGYFSGSATLNSVNLNDVRAIAYNGRLMVFSPTANDLYDITITSVSGMDFTGTVAVYENGAQVQSGNVTVSGTTSEARVQASFAGGTGIAAGSFDILFDTQNNRGATLARMSTSDSNKQGNVYGYYTDTADFRVNAVGAYVGADRGDPQCGFVNTYGLPDSGLNIYTMSHNVTESLNCGFISSGHTGLATVVDTTTTDDTIVFAFANGTISLFGIINK